MLTTRPSVNVSPVILIRWYFTQERLLGTVFPAILLADNSLSAVLIPESKFGWFVIHGSPFAFLGYLKYAAPLSPDTKRCCQKSHDPQVPFPF